MSPPVSSCTSAVPGASQSPRCHGARSGCQRLRRGAVLGCTRIFHRSVIPGGQWPWHPAHPHAVPSLLHLYLHPQGGKTRAASGTHVPAYALVSLPPPLLSSQPGGPLWVWAGGAHLDQGSRAGAGGSWVPQESRHRLWMLPMDLVPHLGHAVVGTTVPPSCRGGVCSPTAPLCPPNPAVPFTPELPSPQLLRSPRREGGTVRQREASPSVFNAPAAGAGQGRGLRVSPLRGAVG